MGMSQQASADAARLGAEERPEALLANRYQLLRKVGVGGMGTGWLAHDQALDARCAVKVVNAELVANAEVRARFAREAKLSAQLRSPHVVDVFDCGESNGTFYIVMEWLDGESLATRIDRDGKLDPASAYRVVAHVARALTRAHSLGIVHRDLKPDNVFLVPGYDEEIAKVLDFGIALDSVYALRDRATREGTFLGTPCYLSPEQARGRPVDHRADLWSLGVMGFECLTGCSPFASDAIGEVMGRILYDPLPSVTDHEPNLPAAVDAWWKRAVARDREQRFQSAKELADELGKALGLERAVTVPPPARARTSSFPEMRASGIYSPVTGETPAAHRAGRSAEPAESPTNEPSPPAGAGAPGAATPPPPGPAEEQELLPARRPPESEPDARVRDTPATVLSGRLRRVPRWLVVTLPVIALLGLLVGVLWQRRQVPEPAAPISEPMSAATRAQPPPRVSSEPVAGEGVPVIPLEKLPREPVEKARRVPAARPRSGAGEPARPAQPSPLPSTRDYGI